MEDDKWDQPVRRFRHERVGDNRYEWYHHETGEPLFQSSVAWTTHGRMHRIEWHPRMREMHPGLTGHRYINSANEIGELLPMHYDDAARSGFKEDPFK